MPRTQTQYKLVHTPCRGKAGFWAGTEISPPRAWHCQAMLDAFWPTDN